LDIALTAIRTRLWRSSEPSRQLLDDYLARASRTLPVSFEEFRSETSFWAWVDKRRGRSPAFLVLCDGQGKSFNSEGLASELERVRERGVQHLVIAIGPADGWTEEARRRADLLLSFGKLTLPHELAAVLAAEQIYRATTIWSGHPYHGGH
jgi:23S rRNA (pseudouridine1915-N3)-methyltransferase